MQSVEASESSKKHETMQNVASVDDAFGSSKKQKGLGEEALSDYIRDQAACVPGVPLQECTFQDFVTSRNYVFRDVTPFFAVAGILPSVPKSKRMLIRPRRWGKTVLGTAWIEYLRGRRDLFRGTWAETRMREDKLIGVHLDFSRSTGSVGICVKVFAKALNDGLALAEKVDGYFESAKGKRVQIPEVHLKNSCGSWTVKDCIEIVETLLDELDLIAAAAKRPVALFVDEYDQPCIGALGRGDLLKDLNYFFADFYKQLKSRVEVIPFVFVIGSSRLSLASFFSGANDIRDLTYDASAVTALGYTWEDIERLYQEQLPLLQKLHGLTRDALKVEMAFWYNAYRWSSDSSIVVFNPWSVNMFVQTGKFVAHWTNTGMSALLFKPSLFDGDMMRMLLVPGFETSLSLADLSGNETELTEDLTASEQMAVLVSSGVLTISSHCETAAEAIPLCIPNMEARFQAEKVLRSTFKKLVTGEVKQAVANYSSKDGKLRGNAVELLVALDKSGAIAECAKSLACGADKVIEKHVHQAISALVLAARVDHESFAIGSEVGVRKVGETKKWLDLAFAVRGHGVGYAIELECYEEPKVLVNSASFSLRNRLVHGLDQLRDDYQDFTMALEISERFYSCMLFGKDAKLIVYTAGLRWEEIEGVQKKLKSGDPDPRVVWLRE